jgi:hypothetical protein
MTTPDSDSVATQSVDRATLESSYAGKAPWDIGKPQPAFAAVADQVKGRVLDAGCGTGEHAVPERFSEGGPKGWFAVVRRKG